VLSGGHLRGRIVDFILLPVVVAFKVVGTVLSLLGPVLALAYYFTRRSVSGLNGVKQGVKRNKSVR
jgi:hypothetical protein